MSLVLDAGALIAIDRNDGMVRDLVETAHRLGHRVVTTAPVVGQAWRDGRRQVRLARALTTVDVLPVELADAKDAGVLLARSCTSDVVDALVTLLVRPGDEVVTSDPDDVVLLLTSRRIVARVRPV